MSFLNTTSPQVASDGRNKIALKPGHSLMDWVRFKAMLPPVRPRKITLEELAKHNSVGDVWTAINGGVYDITQYVEYHPGGVDELMRGAGIDSTDLFNEVHKWVNFQNMLKECHVGYLVSTPSVSLQVPGAKASPAFLKPAAPVTLPTTFVFDSYQTERCFTLIVYGKIPISSKIRSCFYYGTISEDHLNLSVRCLEKRFDLNIKFYDKSKKFDVRNSNLKFEIVVHKEIEKLWPNEGSHLSKSKQTSSDLSSFVNFEGKCLESKQITHDSKLITFELQNLFLAIPPIGSHVYVFNPDRSSVIDKKPYTIFNVISNTTFQLLVKEYCNGVMSSYLCSIKQDESVQMSGFDHYFDLNILYNSKNIAILAAGTGITPFNRILQELYSNQLFKCHSCRLFFYNKTINDILVKDQIESYKGGACHLDVIHVLSKQDDWSGLTGHISLAHLENITKDFVFLTCGPQGFMNESMKVLAAKGVNKSKMFEFKG